MVQFASRASLLADTGRGNWRPAADLCHDDRRDDPTATADDQRDDFATVGDPPSTTPSAVGAQKTTQSEAETVGDAPRPSTWSFARGELRARLSDSTPVSPGRARQLFLTAGFSALVLGSDGHPLYLGRRTRFGTPHQRRVLNARYGTYVVHGCEIPATLCEIDHVKGRIPDGATDIDLLVPCCSFHNRWKADHPNLIEITLRDEGCYRYRIIRPGDLSHAHSHAHANGHTAQP